MTPTPANDNRPRPAEFDARVIQWLPLLRKVAYRLERKAQDREDLINDTVAAALQRWTNYIEGGSFPGWLVFQMRACCSSLRRKRRVVFTELEGDLPTPQRQESQLELRQVVSSLEGRSGTILLRRAMGEGLREIADDMGISRQRVNQLEATERSRLARGLNTVRVMA